MTAFCRIFVKIDFVRSEIFIFTDSNSNAKWILNIKWEMQGIDVHLDTNIGKRLSLLGDTLTSLTGEEDEDFLIGDEPDGRHDVSLEDLSDIQVGYCPYEFCHSLL